MFTKKVKYVLKLLLALGAERQGEGRVLRIEDLAERSGVPGGYIYELILHVRDTGVISSTRGKSGGYRLARDPADIMISAVLRRLGEPVVPLPCLSHQSIARCQDCPDEQKCRLRDGLMGALGSYIQEVEALTLSDLMGRDRSPLQVSAE